MTCCSKASIYRFDTQQPHCAPILVALPAYVMIKVLRRLYSRKICRRPRLTLVTLRSIIANFI